MKQESFFINNQIISVNISQTNNKNMYLKVNHDNQIVVLAPRWATKEQIKKFVLANASKFGEYVEKSRQKILLSLRENYLYLFGKKYNLKYINNVEVASVKLSGNQIYVLTKYNEEKEQLKAIQLFLIAQLKSKILQRQNFWTKEMQVAAHDFEVKIKNSTWGSNVLLKRKIIYAMALAHYPVKVIDYVIVHELAHSLYPNHQNQFWAYVSKFMPDYQDIKILLKNDHHFDS